MAQHSSVAGHNERLKQRIASGAPVGAEEASEEQAMDALMMRFKVGLALILVVAAAVLVWIPTRPRPGATPPPPTIAVQDLKIDVTRSGTFLRATVKNGSDRDVRKVVFTIEATVDGQKWTDYLKVENLARGKEQAAKIRIPSLGRQPAPGRPYPPPRVSGTPTAIPFDVSWKK